MFRHQIERTDEEIETLLEKIRQKYKGGSKFRGMTYEEGLLDMFDWIVDGDSDNPYED